MNTIGTDTSLRIEQSYKIDDVGVVRAVGMAYEALNATGDSIEIRGDGRVELMVSPMSPEAAKKLAVALVAAADDMPAIIAAAKARLQPSKLATV